MKKDPKQKNSSLMKNILKPNTLIIVAAFLMLLGIISTIGLQNQYSKLDEQIQLAPGEETGSNFLEYAFIIGIIISEYAVHLFLILIAYRMKGRSPIFSQESDIVNMVDPLPQALVLTAIVIGLATTALLVGIAMRIYEKYGTFDITKIKELKG